MQPPKNTHGIDSAANAGSRKLLLGTMKTSLSKPDAMRITRLRISSLLLSQIHRRSRGQITRQ